MKKIISLMLAVLLLVAVLSACGEEDVKSDDKNPITIYLIKLWQSYTFKWKASHF